MAVVHIVNKDDGGALSGALLKWNGTLDCNRPEAIGVCVSGFSYLNMPELSIFIPWQADPCAANLAQQAVDEGVLLIWPVSKYQAHVVPMAVLGRDALPDNTQSVICKHLETQKDFERISYSTKGGSLRRVSERLIISIDVEGCKKGLTRVGDEVTDVVHCAQIVARLLVEWAEQTQVAVARCIALGDTDKGRREYSLLHTGKTGSTWGDMRRSLRRLDTHLRKSMASPMSWGQLLGLYNKHCTGYIAHHPDLNECDSGLVNHVVSRQMPWGNWGNTIPRGVLCIDPYADYTHRIKLTTLSDLPRRMGKHVIKSATDEKRTLCHDRAGADAMQLPVPGATGWRLQPVREWKQLSAVVTPEEQAYISAWSPLQETVKTGTYPQSIGQPSWEQAWDLMDAATMAHVLDNSEQAERACLAAQQLRLVYALMGVIVTTTSSYAKRGMYSESVKTTCGRGKLVTRKRNFSECH